MNSPKDVDTSDFLSTFGWSEFEHALQDLINWLAMADKGWDDPFSMEEAPIEPKIFAMLCAAGWISNSWFPKGQFFISEGCVQRLIEKGKLHE